MKKLVFGAFAVILAAATPARAQFGDRPVHMNLGGGFTVPVSDVSDRFGTGGAFNIGVIYDPPAVPWFGLQFEYGFNKLAGEETTIPLFPSPVAAQSGSGIIESHHNLHYLDFNGIFKAASTSIFSPYAISGFGMYYRTVSLTTPDVGFTTVCDPYWYVCFPAAVEVDRIIGDRSGWDPGINFGGGVTIKLGEEALFYVETRWHYMWGPEFTDGSGVTRNANGQYFPVTFGFRF
jgi:hypothetical protein